MAAPFLNSSKLTASQVWAGEFLLLCWWPAFALSGSLLAWVSRTYFFNRALWALTTGLLCGEVASLFSVMVHGQAIPNPRPLWTLLPLVGALCSGIALSTHRQWRIWSGELPPVRYRFRDIDLSAKPAWQRPFWWLVNSSNESNPRRLKRPHYWCHQTMALLTLPVWMGCLSLFESGLAQVMGASAYALIEQKGSSAESGVWCAVFIVELLVSAWLAWILVSSLCLLAATRLGGLSGQGLGPYILTGKFPRHWTRDEYL